MDERSWSSYRYCLPQAWLVNLEHWSTLLAVWFWTSVPSLPQFSHLRSRRAAVQPNCHGDYKGTELGTKTHSVSSCWGLFLIVPPCSCQNLRGSPIIHTSSSRWLSPDFPPPIRLPHHILQASLSFKLRIWSRGSLTSLSMIASC